MRRTERAGLRAPALVLDVKLPCDGVQRVDVSRYQCLYCVVRSESAVRGVTFWDVGEDAVVELAPVLAAQVDRSAIIALQEGGESRTQTRNMELSVVICTRDRPDGLRRCLAALSCQTDPSFDVIVVDSAPSSPVTADLVRGISDLPIVYLREERPGLSRARNLGLKHARGSHTLWLDDDEVADKDLIRQVKRGFSHPDQPAAVCGLMLPAELETDAQVRFEQFDGFNKGRGLSPRVIRLGSEQLRSPLYPMPGFGAGGNMAFANAALRRAGGFDEYLGVGTRTGGGEETRALSTLLRSGSSVLHWPTAITWHYHRRDMPSLVRQMRGYGAGLTAFYASTVFDNPRVIPEIVRLIPRGVRDLHGTQDAMIAPLPVDFPKELTRASRRGLLLGGAYYGRDYIRGRFRAGKWSRLIRVSQGPELCAGQITSTEEMQGC